MHGVPADMRVIEDELSDPTEHVCHAGLQMHAAQRVHAQIEEVQVRDVGHDGADLETVETRFIQDLHLCIEEYHLFFLEDTNTFEELFP